MNWNRKVIAVPAAFAVGSFASGLIAAWICFAILLWGMIAALLTAMLIGGAFAAFAVYDASGHGQ